MCKKQVTNYFAELIKVLSDADASAIEQAISVLRQACDDSKQIFIFGNGGSAATAMHMACDLNNIRYKGKKRFKAYCLIENLAVLTALANDNSYEDVFVEQLKNLLAKDDVVVAISASGNSPNIVKAVGYAKSEGAKIIGMTGFSGGELKSLSDVSIHADVNDYGKAEDFHLICEHNIVNYLKSQTD